MDGGEGLASSPWVQLDANIIACIFHYLSPSSLAQVSLSCQVLRRESESDAVWCVLFLRHFGSDYWGEAAGPHPYHSIPERTNEWRNYPLGEVFSRFAARLESVNEITPDDAGVRNENIESNLNDFVKAHATEEGYGGWKAAYKQMQGMVDIWTSEVTRSFLISGLPSFSVLSSIIDILLPHILSGIGRKPKEGALLADVTSPSGECRVIQLKYSILSTWGSRLDHLTNICVIRKPRAWYSSAPGCQFRGLHIREDEPREPHFIYAVDGAKMDADEDYQNYVYRELHGMLGEGKGQFKRTGLPILLCIINSTSPDAILQRLKISPFQRPGHMCPYYAGPVMFLAHSFALNSGETEVQIKKRRKRLVRGFAWLSKQPSSRAHWDTGPLLLCVLQDQPRLCGSRLG